MTILTNGWLASCVSAFDFADAVSSRRRTGQRQKARRSRRYPKVWRPDGWVKALMDLIIGKHSNAPDLEFQWDQGSLVDPLVQAQIHQI